MTALKFEAGDYSLGLEMPLLLNFPRSNGTQNYSFEIALVPTTDSVTAGGTVGTDNQQQVFPVANITIVDDGEPWGVCALVKCVF